MNVVPARSLGVLVDGARSRGLSIERLTDDLPELQEAIARRRASVGWDDLATLIERLSDALGGGDALRRLAEDQATAMGLPIFQVVGRALASPLDLYTVGVRWMGPSMLPMIEAEMAELGEGRLVQRLRIREGYRDCPGLFDLVHGFLIATPRAWGHEASEVEMAREPRQATYRIRPHSGRQGPITRALRAFRVRRAFPQMLRELEAQQLKIDQGYRELQQAHDRIARQASDLERVNSIGAELSQHIDLDRVADVLIRILLEELGIAAAELWLIRNLDAAGEPAASSPEPRFFRRGGRAGPTAPRRYDLEAAGRAVGRLDVWPGNAVDGAEEALLVRLLPWIAMALDNARSYEALERHAADLEQRVRERTARLLAANHHLVCEIDERRRATEALIESENQLRASERLASIGTLAAGIAHEINNPIGSILAAAQLAQVVMDEPDASGQIRHALSDIEAQAKRCGGIVRSVLQFSRDERTEKWDCRLDEIVRRSTHLTAAFADEHEARVDVDLPPASPWARVNPIQVEQALVNLLRNAVESGARTIRVTLVALAGGDRARIEIRDDGPGIPAREQMRVFEPFYTTKRDAGGTGLGLSVVHGIAAEHGGLLGIHSGEGGGVVVTLELPTVTRPPEPIRDKPEDETDQSPPPPTARNIGP